MEIVINPASDLFYKDEKAWLIGLRNFIFIKILPLALSEKNPYRNEYAKILISDDAMSIWVVAFTHPSVDPNPDSNYEQLEILGDAIILKPFYDILVSKYPNISEEQLTLLKSIYVSKEGQRNLSNKLGLRNWIRINVDVSMQISEDLLESVSGALSRLGDMFLGKGNGYALVFNFMISLYGDIEIDPNKTFISDKSQVKQIFEKMHWTKFKQFKFTEIESLKTLENQTSTEKKKITIKLNDTAVKYIKDVMKSPIIDGGILAEIKGPDKSTIEKQAYDLALKNLKSHYNIDYNWASAESDKLSQEKIPTIAKERMKDDEYLKLLIFS